MDKGTSSLEHVNGLKNDIEWDKMLTYSCASVFIKNVMNTCRVPQLKFASLAEFTILILNEAESKNIKKKSQQKAN